MAVATPSLVPNSEPLQAEFGSFRMAAVAVSDTFNGRSGRSQNQSHRDCEDGSSYWVWIRNPVISGHSPDPWASDRETINPRLRVHHTGDLVFYDLALRENMISSTID